MACHMAATSASKTAATRVRSSPALRATVRLCRGAKRRGCEEPRAFGLVDEGEGFAGGDDRSETTLRLRWSLDGDGAHTRETKVEENHRRWRKRRWHKLRPTELELENPANGSEREREGGEIGGKKVEREGCLVPLLIGHGDGRDRRTSLATFAAAQHGRAAWASRVEWGGTAGMGGRNGDG